jgi:hypothetical protein
MATKPSSTPRWANVGGDIVEPAGGKKDVGWVAEEKPPAQYFNWLLNLTWQWLEYLNDGIFDGNVQFLDNVDIDGDLNVDGSFTIGGAFTIQAIGLLEDSPGTDKVILQAPAVLAADYTLTLPAATPASKGKFEVSASGVITFKNTYTQQIRVREGGEYTGSGWSHNGIGGLSGGTVTDGTVFMVPLDLEVGRRITGIRFIGYGTNNINNTQMRLIRTAHNPEDGLPFEYITGATASITGAGNGLGNQQIGSATFAAYTIIQDESVMIEFTATGGGGASRSVVYIELSMDYGA